MKYPVLPTGSFSPIPTAHIKGGISNAVILIFMLKRYLFYSFKIKIMLRPKSKMLKILLTMLQKNSQIYALSVFPFCLHYALKLAAFPTISLEDITF